MGVKSTKEKCVDLAKKISKTRDGYVCQKCGASKAEGKQIHGAHIVPETWAATCADPANIIALCASCHVMGNSSWHQDPISNARWFDQKYPGVYEPLIQRAIQYSKNPFPKIDWVEVLTELKKQWRQMQ